MNRQRSLILYVISIAGLVIRPAPIISSPTPAPQPVAAGSEELDQPHDELSPAQEQAMWEEIQRNLAMLRSAGIISRTRRCASCDV